jgi:hypothetical protein
MAEILSEAEIQERLKQEAKQQRIEDLAAPYASAAANPGPLRDVFAPQQNIKVGPYSVRPFYDVDFEYLQILDHPFQSFAVGNVEEMEKFVPRGLKGWQLLWLLTTPISEVEQAFNEDDAVSLVNEMARNKFKHGQLAQFLLLYQAIVKQLTVYASAVVGYEPAEEPTKDGKGASKSPPSPAA